MSPHLANFMARHNINKHFSKGDYRTEEQVEAEPDEAIMTRRTKKVHHPIDIENTTMRMQEKEKEERRSTTSGAAISLKPPDLNDDPLRNRTRHGLANNSPYLPGRNSIFPPGSSSKPRQESNRNPNFDPTSGSQFYNQSSGPSPSSSSSTFSHGPQKAQFSGAGKKGTTTMMYDDIESHRDARHSSNNPSSKYFPQQSVPATPSKLHPGSQAGPSNRPRPRITANTTSKGQKEAEVVVITSDDDDDVVFQQAPTPAGLLTQEEKIERRDRDYVDPSSKGKGKSIQRSRLGMLDTIEKRYVEDEEEEEEEEEEKFERGAVTRQQRNEQDRKGKARDVEDGIHDEIDTFPDSPRLDHRRQTPKSPSTDVQHLDTTSTEVANAMSNASNRLRMTMRSPEQQQTYSKEKSIGEPYAPLSSTPTAIRTRRPMKDSNGNPQPSSSNTPQPILSPKAVFISSISDMTLLLPSRTGKTEFYVRPYHCQNAEFGVTQDELNIAHLHDLQVAQLAISLDFISDIGLVKTNEKSPAKAYLSIVIVNPVASTVVHALGGASKEIPKVVLILTLSFQDKRWLALKNLIEDLTQKKGREGRRQLHLSVDPDVISMGAFGALKRNAMAQFLDMDSTISAHPSPDDRPKPRPRNGATATDSHQTKLSFGQTPRKAEGVDPVERNNAATRRSGRLNNPRAPGHSRDDDGMRSPEQVDRKTPPPDPNTVICVWPPAGRSEIHLTKGDLHRLEEGEFLNDTIIEYGLKDIVSRLDGWLEQAKSSAQVDESDLDEDWICHTEDVHVFNSFFYKKLSTAKGKPGTAATAADTGESHIVPWAGYDSVKKWTSKIDIFKKRFIVIPINEHLHWYMAIICNPMQVLTNPKIPSKNTKNIPPTNIKLRSAFAKQKPTEEDQASEQLEDTEDKESNIIRSSQTPEHRDDATRGVCPASKDRSPAEGQASESEFDDTPKRPNSRPLKSPPRASSPVPHPMPSEKDDECIIADKPTARPDMGVILMFDSMGGNHRPAAAKLNKWLAYEAYHKHSQVQLSSSQADGPLEYKEVQVPQQPNYCDCGIYLLHFAEVLFRHPRKALQAVVDQKRKQRGENPITLEVWQALMIGERRKEWKEKVLGMARAHNPANIEAADEGEAVGDVSQGSVVQVPDPTVADGADGGSGETSPSKDSPRDDLMDVDEVPNDGQAHGNPDMPNLENLTETSGRRVWSTTVADPEAVLGSVDSLLAKPSGRTGLASDNMPPTKPHDEDVLKEMDSIGMDVDHSPAQLHDDPEASHQQEQEEYVPKYSPEHSAPIDNVQESFQRTSIGPRRYPKAESEGPSSNSEGFMVDPSLVHSPVLSVSSESTTPYAASHESPTDRANDETDDWRSTAPASLMRNTGISTDRDLGSSKSSSQVVSPSGDRLAYDGPENSTEEDDRQEDDDDAMESDYPAPSFSNERALPFANGADNGEDETDAGTPDEHMVDLPDEDSLDEPLNLPVDEIESQDHDQPISKLVPPRRTLAIDTPPPLSPVTPFLSPRSPSAGQTCSAPQSPATRKRRAAEAESGSHRSTPRKGVKRMKHYPGDDISDDGVMTTTQMGLGTTVDVFTEVTPTRDELPLQPGVLPDPLATSAATPPMDVSPPQPGALTTPRFATKGTATEPVEIEDD